MRILYGVVGEGMGHATRSRVVLEELVKEHEVHIVVSGRAQRYLAERFENVHNIWGLTIAYEGNAVRSWQTLLQNAEGRPDRLAAERPQLLRPGGSLRARGGHQRLRELQLPLRATTACR